MMINESVLCVSLTNKERQVARLTLMSSNSLTVAKQLGISNKTVHHHLYNLRQKMGETSSFTAALKAYYWGLLEVEDSLEVEEEFC